MWAVRSFIAFLIAHVLVKKSQGSRARRPHRAAYPRRS